jgi:GNAT superfamily N-acetyltransferase
MKIEKLTLENVESAYACLHNPPPQSAFWQNFLPHSRLWLKQNPGEHVEGYHLTDKENVVGHIYYVASEKALVEYEIEPNVVFIYCVYLWKEHRSKGLGRKILNHFKEEMRKQGFKGILVEASSFPRYLHHSHFQKQGFKTILEKEPFQLMYFPLTQKEAKIKLRELKYKPEAPRC